MTLRRRRRLLSILPLLALSACASSFPHFGSGSALDSYLIGMDELQGSAYSSAFDAVESLRPQWMRAGTPRTLGTPLDIQVYLDRIAFGTVQALKSVPTESIERIEWVDAATATQRWGTGHTSGVIAVWTRR